MPQSQLLDSSVAAFVFVGMVFLIVKIFDILKGVVMQKRDPAIDLSKAIHELTNFLREDKATQKEINKALAKSFLDIDRKQDETDRKLDKILDCINAHMLSCQKCINK